MSCARRHGSLRCVGGPGPPPEPPRWRALSPTAAARALGRSLLCVFLAGSVRFCSSPRSRFPGINPAFPCAPSQPVARFSPAPACASPVPRLLSLLSSLRLALVASESCFPCSSNSVNPGPVETRRRAHLPTSGKMPLLGPHWANRGRSGSQEGGPWATFPGHLPLTLGFAFHLEFP